jgi:flagellar biosynthesis/type III secretory pathway protein FliH
MPIHLEASRDVDPVERAAAVVRDLHWLMSGQVTASYEQGYEQGYRVGYEAGLLAALQTEDLSDLLALLGVSS